MAMNARGSRAAARSRAQSKAKRCPVAANCSEIEGLWREHDRIEGLAEQGDGRIKERLFDVTQALKDIATFTRAKSMEGALFQIRLLYDCLIQLRDDELSERQQQQIHDQMGCMLYSVHGVVRSALPEGAAAGSRYMPYDHDPLVLFERARRAA